MPKFSSVSFWGYNPILRTKCTDWPQNDLDTFKVKKYACSYIICLRGSNLMSRVSYSPILRKWQQMAPKWPWHMQGQEYVIHTPAAQIFVHFALKWDVLELWLNFQKSAPNNPQMTLTCSRPKILIRILHIPFNHRSKQAPKTTCASIVNQL